MALGNPFSQRFDRMPAHGRELIEQLSIPCPRWGVQPLVRLVYPTGHARIQCELRRNQRPALGRTLDHDHGMG